MADMAHRPERPIMTLPTREDEGLGSMRIAPSRTVTARVAATLTVLFAVVGVVANGAIAVAGAVSVVALVPAALVDLDEGRLPNRMVGAAGVATVAALLATIVVVPPAMPTPEVAHAFAGVGLMAGPLLAMHLVSPPAMGFGDVKAAAVLGIGLGVAGTQLPLVALLLASAGSALTGLLCRRRWVPLGPGLVVGSAVALAVGHLVVGDLP